MTNDNFHIEYAANRDFINSDEYAQKFKGVTASDRGDELVAHYARQAVLDNDGLATEDVYFLNAKNGQLIEHKKLGELGGTLLELSKLKNDGMIVVVHNHPNSIAFSFNDVVTLNDYPEFRTIIAAGHDGTVYFLSIGDGRRLELSDNMEFGFFDRYWARHCRDYGSRVALEKISEEMGWRFNVK